ncbi:Serine protease 28 [Eumeta japonica]|uniref:Serine protease 28 n=1 Tax=Eumeta variegata TaxID=151549 RepID=A0A4C1ZPF7_EUMVA|nr:Serine protease 28 [Eumeta japonica]
MKFLETDQLNGRPAETEFEARCTEVKNLKTLERLLAPQDVGLEMVFHFRCTKLHDLWIILRLPFAWPEMAAWLGLFFSVLTFGFYAADAAPKEEYVGVVGGEPTRIEDFPYQVSVRVTDTHICGGIIIHKQFILTAAHCTTRYFIALHRSLELCLNLQHILRGGFTYDITNEVAKKKRAKTIPQPNLCFAAESTAPRRELIRVKICTMKLYAANCTAKLNRAGDRLDVRLRRRKVDIALFVSQDEERDARILNRQKKCAVLLPMAGLS